MIDGQVYECRFVNDRDTYVDVEESKRLFLRLAPGQERAVRIWDESVTYGPFKKIRYLNDDKIEVTTRKGFDADVVFAKEGHFVVELLNLDGRNTEGILVNGESYVCHRGIPRFIPFKIGTEFCFYTKVTLIKNVEKVVAKKFPDYLIYQENIEWRKEKRSDKEIRQIIETMKASWVKDHKSPQAIRRTINVLIGWGFAQFVEELKLRDMAEPSTLPEENKWEKNAAS